MRDGVFRQNRCLMFPWKFRALAFFCCVVMQGYAQKVATLDVQLDRPTAGIEVPAHLALGSITHVHDSALRLVEVRGSSRTPVDFQIEHGKERIITWLVKGDAGKRTYELVREGGSRSKEVPSIKTEINDGALTLKAGNNNLLRYHFETVYPPANIDSVYGRSGFIHPLWSPRGEVLTRIQPPDHYHHYGLWNPWTHTLFEGDTVDFWNLNARQGTVRFEHFISTTEGNIFGEYAALQAHIALKSGAPEKVAINEVQTVRVYAPQPGAEHYIADITIAMNCPGSPVRLLEYRYGGLGWRATEKWTKENSSVISSEGRTRKDADGTRARWCIVQGAIDGRNSGVVMMSYPANFNHPEPLRIWPENANGNRGDVFANFSPTKNKDWPLEKGKTQVLKYRFIVFDGTFSQKQAETAWHYFAYPPIVRVAGD